MLYAILCYDSESVVSSWSKDEDEKVMTQLLDVQSKLREKGRLGPVARLAPTQKAFTLRKTDTSMLVDGPFAETKEQLLGFYVVDCETREEVVEIARDLGLASSTKGAYEIRPLIYFAANGIADSNA